MIQLNVDFSLLNNYFGVSIQKLSSKYVNKDFEEIMELEAADGNEQAQNYKSILSDPTKIAEIFKLSNVENKYMILQNMSEGDLDELLQYLTPKQLSLGLYFFNDDKLLQMVNNLPIEEIIGMVFQAYDIDDVLKTMEDSALDAFLREPSVDREYSQKYFETLDESKLQSLMLQTNKLENINKSKEENLEYLKQMNDAEFLNFTISLNKKEKCNLISSITEQDDETLLLFEASDLTRPMSLMMKDDKIKMMQNLEPEFLIGMVQNLPLDLTQLVLTQIDSDEFAEVLADDYQDILKSVVFFSSGSS